MILELLGPNLEDLFITCKKKFSLKTVLMLADQCLQRFETIHEHGIVFRDVKPQNFLMGLNENSHVVYLIDFGLSKKFKEESSNQLLPYREGRSLVGTARYSSLNTHLGIEQSRRDDLQSLGYMLVYFLKGFLPWQGERVQSKTEKYAKIAENKMRIPIELLCKGLPLQFCMFLNYARGLKYEEKPDYSLFQRMFRSLLARIGEKQDFVYDWCVGSFQPKDTGNIMLHIVGKREKSQTSQQPKIMVLEEEDQDSIEESDIMLLEPLEQAQ